MEPVKKKYFGGRPPKEDPAIHRYGIKLTSEEKLKFEKMFEKSGLQERSKYIKSVLFSREIKVVKIDKATMDYYIQLRSFHYQFQAIGNNYNQIVRALKSNFGENKGLQMLFRLEKATIELAGLCKKIVQLTEEYEAKWLRK